jgi:hypothetical protein
MQSFLNSDIRKFAPKSFDQFIWGPSSGASGGLLVLWNSSVFAGTLVFQESFAIVVRFTSTMYSDSWTLVNVYGPCSEPRRSEIINLLLSLDIPDEDLWLLKGGFNFYRFAKSRNKDGANMHDTFIFNEVINHLGLIELPIKGRSYT